MAMIIAKTSYYSMLVGAKRWKGGGGGGGGGGGVFLVTITKDDRTSCAVVGVRQQFS